MRNIIIILLLIVVVGCSTHDTHSGLNVPYSHSHSHESREASEPFSSVDLIVHEDPKSGWNLQITTENFIFSPQQASLEHVEGQGHAHLHINDNKITRIYDGWYHIPPDWLNPGEHTFTITLSSNDHKDYTVNGEVISDTEIVVVG